MFEKFKKWFNYNQPYAATGQGWDDYYDRFKKNAPVRYYLNEFFDKMPRVFRRFRDIKYWFLYRFHPKHRYHIVNSGLGYGYHDTSELLLYSAFSLLVDHVEISLAMKHEEYKVPFKHWIRHPFSYYRSPRLGLSYLKWEIEHTGPVTTSFGTSSNSQSGCALEVYTLYSWWKAREYMQQQHEPKEPSGYAELHVEKGIFYSRSIEFQTKYPELYDQYTKYMLDSDVFEQNSTQLDNLMLMRLINIRTGLWT